MNLRPYQQEAIDAINVAYGRRVRRQLLAMATGAGKTVVLAQLIRDRVRAGGNALVIAHKDSLVSQAVAKISGVLPWQDMGIVKAEQNRPHAKCVVASVQTLSRPRRLAAMPQFDTIIIDECHRSTAKGYLDLIRHCGHEETLLLGCTATPRRTDGVGLDRVYDEIVYEVGILDLINQGYLVPLRGRKVYIPADFSKLHTRTNTDGISDYRQDEVVDLMNKANWYQKVTEAWLDYASDRRTIAFVPPGRDENKRPAAMAHTLAEYMRAQGIRAAALDGTTDKGIQRSAIAAFERGEVQVLVNVDLMVEGVDIPSTNCVLFARLTKSHIVKMQAIGRGTRLSPETGKTDCLVLDMVGATNDLDMVTLGDLVGVKALQDDESVTEAIKREKEEAELLASEQQDLPEIADGQMVGEEVDLFQSPEDRAKKRKLFEWEINSAARHAKLHAGGRVFEIRRVSESGPYVYADMSWTGKLQGQTFDYLEAKAACEAAAKDMIFGGPNAAWRQNPASEKQINLLRKNKIPFEPNITKEEAGKLLQPLFDRWARKRKNANV